MWMNSSTEKEREQGMPVDPNNLRLAMRRWATGVTIVSVEYKGIQHGMTVSSFTSVSLEPPTVLVSLERIARTHDLVMKAGSFGVTILSTEQQEISDRFAGRKTEYENRFLNLNTHILVSNAPFIDGGLAFFDCRVLSTLDSGTHTLFIGEVLAVQFEEGEHPLLYYNQQYRRLHD